MLVVPAALRSAATVCRSQALATLWKITRTDGTIYRFTDWHCALKFREADSPTLTTFTPTEGVDGSARRRADELEETNKELRGIVSATAIKAADLRAGRFDGATVDEFLVNAQLPWAGYLDHARYYVRQVSYDRGVWNAEVEGIASFLHQPCGDTWSPLCGVDLFSAACGLSAASFENTTGEVASIQTQRRIFTLTYSVAGGLSPWNTTGYGNDGTLIWTSGANNGLTLEIKEHTDNASGGVITLHIPAPYDIAVGDDCTLRPGCDKKSGVEKDAEGKVVAGHCKDRFNNLVNFQGFPYIPGRDRALQGIPIV